MNIEWTVGGKDGRDSGYILKCSVFFLCADEARIVCKSQVSLHLFSQLTSVISPCITQRNICADAVFLYFIFCYLYNLLSNDYKIPAVDISCCDYTVCNSKGNKRI